MNRKQIVVVMRRFIPIDAPSTDICTRVCDADDTLEDVLEWAHSNLAGNCPMVSLEITEADAPAEPVQ